MGKYLSIQDAIKLSGKSRTTLYRYINSGKLKTYKREFQGKQIHGITIKDLESCLGYKINGNGSSKGIPRNNRESHENTMEFPGESHESSTVEVLTKENLMNAIDEALSHRETKLMKPLEELATYRVGKLEQLIEHLKAEKDVLRIENEQLRESMKALPGPVEQIISHLEEKEIALTEAVMKKEELEADLQEKIEVLTKVKQEKELIQKAKDKALSEMERLKNQHLGYDDAEDKYNELKMQLEEKQKELTRLEGEKSRLIEKLEAENDELREALGGKDQRIKDLEEDVTEECNQKVLLHKSLLKVEEDNKELQEKMQIEAKKQEELQVQIQTEREEQEAKLKEEKEKAEREKEELAKIWREELEQERNKPWWRKLFG